MKLQFNQKSHDIFSAFDKLPVSNEFLPLYFEIMSKTESHLIWSGFSDLLKDICKDNPEYREIILSLLEDDKTKGARGYLLNAVRCFKTFDKRTIDIMINEIATGNFECRNKASDILSIIYESSGDEIKDYIRSGINEAKMVLSEHVELLNLFKS